MYSLLKRSSSRELLLQQLPGLSGSLLVAEVFFKFGSFSLEVVAFLLTWFVLDTILQSLRTLTDRQRHQEPQP